MRSTVKNSPLSKDTEAVSSLLSFHPTARGWPREVMTVQSGCGTQLRKRKCWPEPSSETSEMMKMNKHRWQQVETLYHAALERALGARGTFLAQALRREIASLLNYDDSPASFIQVETEPNAPLTVVVNWAGGAKK